MSEDQRLCAHCGNEFTPINQTPDKRWSYKKYCSYQCERHNFNANRREFRAARRGEPEVRPCLHCGKEFTPTKYTPHKKYCSLRCGEVHKFIRNYVPASPPQERPCAHCGNGFTPGTNTGHQKYCGKRCREDAYQAQQRANTAVYREANREKILARNAADREANREAIRANQRAWNAANKERLTLARREREYVRYLDDPLYAITVRLRARVRGALKQVGARKSGRTFDLVGCSVADLIVHLESQFQPGMTWEKRSEWHIDHIIPCAAFDLTDPEQQKLCFHYTNLQPLWGPDNLRKGNMILDEVDIGHVNQNGQSHSQEVSGGLSE